MNKKLLILAGVLIAVAIVLYVLAQTVFNTNNLPAPTQTTPEQTNETETQEIVFPLDDIASSNLIAQASREFGFALSKAREWRDDCAPAAVLVKYSGNIDPRNGKNTYIFISPSLSQYYFTITIDQSVNAKGENNYERLLYFKDDYFLPKNTTVIPMKYWVMNYVDVLKKADDLGGKDVRTANKNYDVNLVLSQQEGGYLIWDIEYMAEGIKQFGVSIDSYQGEVQ